MAFVMTYSRPEFQKVREIIVPDPQSGKKLLAAWKFPQSPKIVGFRKANPTEIDSLEYFPT